MKAKRRFGGSYRLHFESWRKRQPRDQHQAGINQGLVHNSAISQGSVKNMALNSRRSVHVLSVDRKQEVTSLYIPDHTASQRRRQKSSQLPPGGPKVSLTYSRSVRKPRDLTVTWQADYAVPPVAGGFTCPQSLHCHERSGTQNSSCSHNNAEATPVCVLNGVSEGSVRTCR